MAPWWETSARACWVQCWAGGTALLRLPSCLDPEGTGSPDVPAPSPAAAPRPRTPRQPLPQRQSLSPSPSRGRCLMLGAGAPWAWGGCGTGPPSHVSPTARGEQRGAVPISTQGFYQPPPVTTATVASVYLPGEGRSAIEMGRAGARFVLWLGEERFPCNGFNGGFWGMEGGGCPGRGARARECSRLPRADPQQRGASPGGRGHFVPGAESGRPLELAHG